MNALAALGNAAAAAAWWVTFAQSPTGRELLFAALFTVAAGVFADAAVFG